MSTVIVKDLHKTYGTGENAVTVLKDACITVQDGQLVSLMGSFW